MRVIFCVVLCVSLCATEINADVTVGFDGGDPSGFIGNAVFESVGGNPGGNAHINQGGPFFFPEIRTGGLGEPSNPAFLGDFSAFNQVTIGFDVRVDSITDFIGNEIPRPFGIMLIDRDIMGPSGPSGVFFETPALSASIQDDWTNYSVSFDPRSTELPDGWIGFGDEDMNTFEPIFPEGASFASVLAGVDEFRLTGGVPGFFFNDAFFDVRIDNVSINAVPEPGSTSMICLAALALMGRRRSVQR